jgi:hypothetical protein
MALSVAKGSFACNTSTGNQDVSVGFLPKAVIVWGTNQTSTGYAAGNYNFLGISDGTTQCCISGGSDDAQTSLQAGSAWSEAAVIQQISDATTPTIDSVATVTFTGLVLRFNWSNAPGSAWLVHYIALGGTDVSAKVLITAAKTSTGAQARTGVGFAPKALIPVISPVTSSTTGGYIINSWGIATATAQVVMGLFEFDGSDPTQVGSIWTEGDFYRLTDEFTDPYSRATLTSLDADGWTENWLTSSGTGYHYGVLALGGTAQFESGIETQKTSTGTKDTTVGFTPTGLFAISTNATATGRTITACKHSIGGSDGTNEGAIWCESVDNVADSNTNSATIIDKVLRFAASDTTTNAEADSSFGANKFTLDWTTADATARKFAWLAMAGAPAVGGSLVYNPQPLAHLRAR